MELELGWAALVLLFAASLLTVSAWLLQYSRGVWSGRGKPETSGGALREAGIWKSLLRLRVAPDGAPEEAVAGARGLLASLFAFRSFRENWQRAWVRALNEQACRHGVRGREEVLGRSRAWGSNSNWIMGSAFRGSGVCTPHRNVT